MTPYGWSILPSVLNEAMLKVWNAVACPDARIALESLRQGVLFGGEVQRWLDADAAAYLRWCKRPDLNGCCDTLHVIRHLLRAEAFALAMSRFRGIAEQMTAFRGNGASWVLDKSLSPDEAGYLKHDSSRVHSDLNWSPQLSLQQALEPLVCWYRSWQSGSDMQVVTLIQIKQYDALPKP